MTVILGYCDRFSVAPGQTLQFMVGCTGCDRYRADIVRLLRPDTGPKAPPLLEEVVDVPANGEYPGREQDIQIGSCVVVPESAHIASLESFTLQAMVWPTRLGNGRAALLGTWSDATEAGFGLGLDATGALELRLGDGAGEVAVVSTGRPLAERRWYLVAASFDGASRMATLYQETVPGSSFDPPEAVRHEEMLSTGPAGGSGSFLIAAWQQGETADCRRITGCHYNGKIDRPRLANRALTHDEIGMLAGDTVPDQLHGSVVAAWDFARDIPTVRITDIGPHGLHGETVNLPSRAMTGHNWTGEEMNWQRAPAQYGAIHFHDDDLYDAGWQPDFELTLPTDLRSGIYAARLRADDAEHYVPFFVRPAASAATARIAYLAPTATYMAYFNNTWRVVDSMAEMLDGSLDVYEPLDLFHLDHPELGRSTYCSHRDGSGVCYSSRLRPATNIRPTGRLWNFPLDLFIIEWLEWTGLGYDVITDEDLHRQGVELLSTYRTVITGSHPEYYSLEMLDALDAWLRRGGRLMYMGGNGFYWRVSWHSELPGVLEVRRGESGTRSWDADVGEYYQSFTGENGGLWRRQRRAPNVLTGVGFSAQGFDACGYYRRTAASGDSRVGFMFDGIDDEILGDFGIALGGAVGLEVDSADQRLGTPVHTLVVATSEGLTNSYQLVVEDMCQGHGPTDATNNPKVRADMVFFETEGGGAVFSTGSIAYVGSLGANDFDNNIAKLTTNVLRRFADDAPFEIPA